MVALIASEMLAYLMVCPVPSMQHPRPKSSFVGSSVTGSGLKGVEKPRVKSFKYKYNYIHKYIGVDLENAVKMRYTLI